MQETFGDHGQDEVALARGLGGKQRIQAEAAHHAEYGLNVAVRQVALDKEGVGGGDELLAGQGAADDVDQLRWQVGDVAEGFVADLGADAEGAAEQVGLVKLALVGAGSGGHLNRTLPGGHGSL